MNYFKITMCFMLIACNSQAQDFVTFNKTNIMKTTKDELVKIILPFEIVEGYHIQSEIESTDGSITTDIVFEENDLIEILSYSYSKKNNEIVVLNQFEYNVLTDKFEVTVTLKRTNKTLKSSLTGQLYYQACTDKQCLFPRTLNFEIPKI